MFQDKPKSTKLNSHDFKDIESLIDNWSKPPVVKKPPRKNAKKSVQNHPDTYSRSLNPFEPDDEEDVNNLNPFEVDEDEAEQTLNPFDTNDDDGEADFATDEKNASTIASTKLFTEERMKEDIKVVQKSSSNPFDEGFEESGEIHNDPNLVFSDDRGKVVVVNDETVCQRVDQQSNVEHKFLETKSSACPRPSITMSAEKEHDEILTNSSQTQSPETVSATDFPGCGNFIGDDDNNSESATPQNVTESKAVMRHVGLHGQEESIPRNLEADNTSGNSTTRQVNILSHEPTSNVTLVTSTAYPEPKHRDDPSHDSVDKVFNASTEDVLEKQDMEHTENHNKPTALELQTQLTSSAPSLSETHIGVIPTDPTTDAVEERIIGQNHDHEKDTGQEENKRESMLGMTAAADSDGQNTQKQFSNNGSSKNPNDRHGSEHSGEQNAASTGGSKTNTISASSSSSQSCSNLNSTDGDIVLVTGGNGFLGQHIVKMLHRNAPYVKEIRVLDKKPFVKRLDYEATKPVKVFTGSITDSDFVRASVKGANSILHIAGLVSFGTFPDVEGMKEVNVNGTLNIVNACLAEPSVSRLVYCSTVDVVVGHEPIRGGDEDNTPVPRDFLFPGYPETKYQGERVVLGASMCSRTPGPPLQTLALRANVMYGELDPYYVTSGLKMAKQRNGVLTQIGDGRAMFQQAYVGNTAWAFVCADRAMREDPNLTSKFFYVPDRTPIQNSFNFMRPYLEARGFQLSESPISYNLVYGAIFAAEKMAKIVSPLKKLNLPTQSCSIAYINMDLYFKGDKAKELLKFEPMFSPVEARLLSMEYYKKVEL